MYVIKNIDLKGQRFERLLVLEAAGKDHRGNRLWRCLCDCGNITEVITWRLRSGNTRSCGCIKDEQRKNLNLLPSGEAAFTQLFYQYQGGAKDRGIEWSLSKELFRELVETNCSYCGRVPFQIKSPKGANGSYIHGGIDRIDSTLGYSAENSVPCCKVCNFMKLDMTREAFIQACRAVVDRSEKQNGTTNVRSSEENAQEHIRGAFEA